MAVDGRVFDVGLQTGEALKRMKAGTPAARAGLCGSRNNGNGSLMRCLPVALLLPGDDRALVEAAHLQSIVTHAHPRSQVCCALYCLWARREMQQVPDAWESAVACLRDIYGPGSPFRQELETEVRPDEPPHGTGTGYVVDCLHSARLACCEPDYERIVRRAVSLGNDTDTTACVAGGIAGLRHGTDAIPRRWLGSLRGREIAFSLLTQWRVLLAESGGPGA
jgi:ADP-ribosylglycohydrolase